MKKLVLALSIFAGLTTGILAKAEATPPRTVIVRVEKATGAVSMAQTDDLIESNAANSVVSKEYKPAQKLDELDRDSSTSGWYYYYGAYQWAAPTYYYYGSYYTYTPYYFYEYSFYYYYFYRW